MCRLFAQGHGMVLVRDPLEASTWITAPMREIVTEFELCRLNFVLSEVGKLVHISPDLEVDREIIVEGPPAHPMTLGNRAEKSQSYA